MLVADPAYFTPEEDPDDENGGYVDPAFYGQEGTVDRDNGDGTWTVRVAGHSTNQIHGNWLTPVLPTTGAVDRIQVGDMVRIADPAYSTADGGGVRRVFYGQTAHVDGTGLTPGVFRVRLSSGDTNYVHERWLTRVPIAWREPVVSVDPSWRTITDRITMRFGDEVSVEEF